MLVTSFKPLDEIRSGNMLALPQDADASTPGVKAWSTAQIGVELHRASAATS